jgi:putative FmdB family regulatory protein
MPIYNFGCQECGNISEFLLSSSSEHKKPVCQNCGSRNLERLMSAPGILRNLTNSSATCCGRTERCETPPCSTGERCHRH